MASIVVVIAISSSKIRGPLPDRAPAPKRPAWTWSFLGEVSCVGSDTPMTTSTPGVYEQEHDYDHHYDGSTTATMTTTRPSGHNGHTDLTSAQYF